MFNVVSNIVNNDICSGCGVCAGICPQMALSMRLRKNGDLAPYVDAERCSENCHLCLDICPFSKGFHNPRQKNIELFSTAPAAIFDEDIGWHADTLVGYRKDEALRKSSSSGGLATWTLEALLKKGFVTRVAVVRLARQKNNGFFEFYAAASVKELRKSSGSVYHPIEISNIINLIANEKKERWAIVGVPCLCVAIRNVRQLRHRVPFVLGLACGMYQNTFYTEILLDKSGVDRRDIINIEYRRKSEGAAPSDFRFRGTDNRGPGKEIAYNGLPYYLGKNAFFRLNACNFCMDVFSEAADACFMDAWLPDYRKESKGTSLVVVRNRVITELMQQGKNECELSIEKVNPDKIKASQKGHVRRKRELIYMRGRMQRQANVNSNNATIEDKLDWWIQRHLQERSKKAWLLYGRKYGQAAFWTVLSDLLIAKLILRTIVTLFSLTRRTAGKCRKILKRSF